MAETTNGNGNIQKIDNVGGRKFVLILVALVIFCVVFYLVWLSKILNENLCKWFLLTLSYILTVGISANVIEKLIPLLPDIASRLIGLFTGKKPEEKIEVKP